MLPSLLVGLSGAAAVTLAVAVYNRAPTRSQCPECGEATCPVLLPPVLRENEFVHLRWCPRCRWQGLGRNGPEWVPGRRLAHASGFHWGKGRFQPDFGFRFRYADPPHPAPPHHPSGFRFGETPAPAAERAHHPSGFRFGEAPAPAAEGAHHPSGFRFGKAPAAEGAHHPSGFRFRWRSGEAGASHVRFRFGDGRPSPSSRAPGFTWAEEGTGAAFRFRETRGGPGSPRGGSGSGGGPGPDRSR